MRVRDFLGTSSLTMNAEAGQHVSSSSRPQQLTHEHLDLHHERLKVDRRDLVHDVELVAEIVSPRMQRTTGLLAPDAGGLDGVAGNLGLRIGGSDVVDADEGLLSGRGVSRRLERGEDDTHRVRRCASSHGAEGGDGDLRG